MDKIACGCEKEFRLGTVARTLSGTQDLFAVMSDPLSFSGRQHRFPSGPAIMLPQSPGIPANFEDEMMELERWDGLS